MVDFNKLMDERRRSNDLRRERERRKVTEGQPMTRVVGGPSDGTEVLVPPDCDKGKFHGIGITAEAVHQELSSGKVTYCCYIWYPRHQQYRWVDFYQAANQQELVGALQYMANIVGEN